MNSKGMDMVRWIKTAGSRIAGAALAMAIAGSAWALTPEEEAAVAISQQWVKAITTRDVDAQVKLMPPTMFPKEGDRERARLARLHDNELAVVRKQKVTMFGLGPPMQTLKLGAGTAVIVPYKSAVETAGEGRMQVESSLIALTLDGKTWSVFDGSGQNNKSLKSIIPGYPGGLNVPTVRSVAVKTE